MSVNPNSEIFIFPDDRNIELERARVKTQAKEVIELHQTLDGSSFSTGNLGSGVYTLDIIVSQGSIRAAYEGILVIGQSVENLQNIIEQQITEVNVYKDDNVFDDKEIVCLYHPN